MLSDTEHAILNTALEIYLPGQSEAISKANWRSTTEQCGSNSRNNGTRKSRIHANA